MICDLKSIVSEIQVNLRGDLVICMMHPSVPRIHHKRFRMIGDRKDQLLCSLPVWLNHGCVRIFNVAVFHPTVLTEWQLYVLVVFVAKLVGTCMILKQRK
jgi:hypothetical protein